MIKIVDVYKVGVEDGTIDDIIHCFIKSAEIVFVVKGEGKLLGAVTEGDMNRYFKSMEKIPFNKLFNTNIKYINYKNENQIYEDAEKLFNENGKVNSIPVVDETGNLLFQINRSEKNITLLRDIKYIYEAINNGSLEYFLHSFIGKEIIITGAQENYLQEVLEIIYQHYEKLIIEIGITIKIAEDICNKLNINKGTQIISLNWFGFMYLYNIKNIRADIITASELAYFYNLKNLDKYSTEVIENFIQVFKYKAVGYYYLNDCVLPFIKTFENCGLKIYNLTEDFISSEYITDNISSGMVVFLISGRNEEYIEKIKVTDLLLLIERIWWYKKLKGQELTYVGFLESCVNYLDFFKDKGFEGFIQSVESFWDYNLHSNIMKKSRLEVITKNEDIKYGKRYIVDEKNLHKQVYGNMAISVKEHFLKAVCEKFLYEIIKEKCKNVYICSNILSMPGVKYGERDRYNYIENKELFSSNFAKEISGGDDFYLTRVIKDAAECQRIKLNDFYCKFLSNYHSKYFNTDLYGNRIVTGLPEEYMGTVWIMGNCVFSGYAVEDKYTVASYIQSYINLSGYKYRVVNLSCDKGGIGLYNKLIESNILPDDIVIIQTKAFIQSENLITIDYNELNGSLKNQTWFWDNFGHMGYAGYRFLAKKIFNIIKPVMKKDFYSYKFYLNNDLEIKIKNYIESTIKLILEDNKYKQVLNIQNNSSGFNRISKAGAVVMNCNPFTYGHQYLIDTVSRLVNVLYVFVVEEDKSVFSFNERFDMVCEGTKQYANVVVLPSGKFMISSATFPGYFMKDTPIDNSYDDFLDLKIFAHYIAPAFGIETRFVGEEPFDRVTAQYNYDMQIILKEAGIDVIEIPRKMLIDGEIISATKARKFLKEKDYISLKDYLPETTIQRLRLV